MKTADENMLYGLLALQLGFVGREEMLGVFAAIDDGGLEKTGPLGEMLIERGMLTPKRHDLLAVLVTEYLRNHQGNTQQCLESMVATDSNQDVLEQLTDRNPEATVAFVSKEGLTQPTPEASDGATRKTSSGERFRIIRSHAKGGLGEVSVAQDEQLNREVALKELQDQHADDPEKRQRFVLEGEVTGALEHPGIVPIYALGHDAQLRPFYAMRLIRGESLGDAIAQFHRSKGKDLDLSRGSLPLRRLLGQLVDICNAIEYAHSRGVLHRDLKPANVMLGKYGETLVVDWGMARVVGRQQEATESVGEGTIQTTALSGSVDTLMGSVKGTPAYMSPEQAAGQIDALGPTSDVYSLGATLYCLLTNHHPIESKNLTEILRRVEVGEFPPPCEVQPAVPRPLNAICLHAMARYPSDRYGSPQALADDLERWLGDEAVSAYRERPVERLARWARRHRTLVLAAVISTCLVALVAGMATLLVNQARSRAVALAQQNSQLATQEAQARAEAVTRFSAARDTVDRWLTGFSEALKYYPGVQPFRTRMLQQAALDYESFAADRTGDPALELERGRAYVRLGDVRRLLGEHADAEQAYQEAMDVLKPLQSTTDHPNSSEDASVSIDTQIDWARCQNKLGLLHTETGSYERAQKEYRGAVGLLQELMVTHPETSRGRDALGRALTNLGRLRLLRGQQELAKETLLSATREFEFLNRAHPTEAPYLVGLATAQLGLGQSLLQNGQADQASTLFRQASQALDVLIQLDEDNPEYLQSRATAGLFLASALRAQGQYALEAASYQKALEDYSRLSTAIPDVPVYRENLALTQTDYGQLLFELGHAQQAQSELTHALAVIEKLAAYHPQVPRYQEERAVCLDNLGEAIGAQGANETALARHEQAVASYRQLAATWPEVSAYRERLAIGLSHQGLVLQKLERSKAALKHFQQALEMLDTAIRADPKTLSYRRSAALIGAHLGDAFGEQSEQTKAQVAYQNAEEHWNKILALTSSPDYLNDAAWFWANCREAKYRHPNQAVIYAQQAVDAAPNNPTYWGTLAAAHYRAGDFSNSEKAVLRAIAARGDDHARDLLLRSMAEFQLGKRDQARKTCQRAQRWLRKYLPGNLELQRLQDEATGLLEQASTIQTPAEEPTHSQSLGKVDPTIDSFENADSAD